MRWAVYGIDGAFQQLIYMKVIYSCAVFAAYRRKVDKLWSVSKLDLVLLGDSPSYINYFWILSYGTLICTSSTHWVSVFNLFAWNYSGPNRYQKHETHSWCARNFYSSFERREPVHCGQCIRFHRSICTHFRSSMPHSIHLYLRDCRRHTRAHAHTRIRHTERRSRTKKRTNVFFSFSSNHCRIRMIS